jgi:hypothetical protein
MKREGMWHVWATGNVHHTVLVGGGKKTLGRPKRRWKDNIKMDFKWVGRV